MRICFRVIPSTYREEACQGLSPARLVVKHAVGKVRKAKAPEKANAARLQLAYAYQGEGHKQKALNEVTQVLTRDPDNEAAQKLKNLLSR